MSAAQAEVPLRPRYPGVALALARYRARRIIEHELRSQGVRVQYVPIRDIRERAQAYLETHREELLAQAMEAVRSDPKLSKMAEIEERKRERQWRKMQRKLGVLDRQSRSVSGSGNDKSGTDIAQVFNTTSAIFGGSRLLFTF